MSQLVEFTYDGYQKAIIATENCILNYTLVGGGGGGGGPDTYAGCTGLSGVTVNGTVTLNKGDKIYVAVGQGGRGGGGQGSSHPGGVGGNGLNGFSGGTGGYSGGSGSSGAGAGGGAATVLSYDASGAVPIAIAPGGGAGGGGGNHGGAPLYSSSPYGDTSTYTLKYYPNAATNGAYCAFLNRVGVWNGNGWISYEVYFPETADYTFTISGDNEGSLNLDGVRVVDVGGSERGHFDTAWSANKSVTVGWHTIAVYGNNWGGPASVGAACNRVGYSEFWNTRYAYNPLSAQSDKGRGGHGVDYRGDGGGAGGGGGGYNGGRGGSTRSGDVGGYSGSTGYAYNLFPSSTTVGSPSSYGAGGIAYSRPTGGYPGGDGYAAFEAIQSDINVKSGSIWKRVTGLYVRQSFTFLGFNVRYWAKVPALYVRSNGEWKKVYGDNNITYYSTTSAYNTTSGPYPG